MGHATNFCLLFLDCFGVYHLKNSYILISSGALIIIDFVNLTRIEVEAQQL